MASQRRLHEKFAHSDHAWVLHDDATFIKS